jgi:sodium/hydrogen exchanger-like protein 6/7
MLFWAGLRGAVGVALAAGLQSPNGPVLRATVLVVVVLTVIIFGGTTARMLEILNIKTGVVEEIDSDDEFDIEYVGGGGNGNGLANGTYAHRSGTAFGHNPRYSVADLNATVPLGTLRDNSNPNNRGTYSSGNSPPTKPDAPARRNSARSRGVGSDRTVDAAEQGLLSPGDSLDDEYEGDTDLDLPPAAKRVSPSSRSPHRSEPSAPYPTAGSREAQSSTPQGRLAGATAAMSGMTGAVSQLISGISEDPASAFRQIDESFIKPRLLLDPGGGNGDRGHNGAGGS